MVASCKAFNKALKGSPIIVNQMNLNRFATKLENYLEPVGVPEAVTIGHDEGEDNSSALAVFDDAQVFMAPFLRATFYQYFIMQKLEDLGLTPLGKQYTSTPLRQPGATPLYALPADHQQDTVFSDAAPADLPRVALEMRSWFMNQMHTYQPQLKTINKTFSLLPVDVQECKAFSPNFNPVAMALATKKTKLLTRLTDLTDERQFQAYLSDHLLHLIPEPHRNLAVLLQNYDEIYQAENSHNSNAETMAHLYAEKWNTIDHQLLRLVPKVLRWSVAVGHAAMGDQEALAQYLTHNQPHILLGAMDPNVDLLLQLVLVVSAANGHERVVDYVIPKMKHPSLKNAHALARLMRWHGAEKTLGGYLKTPAAQDFVPVQGAQVFPLFYLHNNHLVVPHYGLASAN
ncbi:hypothetical protein IWQ60_003304 [Tieghemiomyces parasiticus]|uniref:Uncharacterized protein n=1 Tax=Tieghemiomyces parasiticus TaxID=78921 RepID=A0A9W8AD49_9FUNG|nr:hypothetical protein IWQ60_003304 [Tieghemiomyces parasiticus]